MDRARLTPWVVLAATVLAAAPIASADPPAAAGGYAGVYASDTVTVTLKADGPGYTGSIRKGTNDFPLTATATADHLTGSFHAGGKEFPFQATLDGNTLTLTSGKNTFVCVDDNPLDPPGGRPAAAGAAAATDNPLGTGNPLGSGTTPPPPANGAGNVHGDVTGKWAITGDLGADKFSITFGADHTITVETADGSSSGGTGFKYADGKVTFDGSSQMNALTVGGTWTLDWKSPDAFTTVDSGGKALSFQRVRAGK